MKIDIPVSQPYSVDTRRGCWTTSAAMFPRERRPLS